MASSGVRLLLTAGKKGLLNTAMQTRNMVTKETGAILDAPQKNGVRGLLGVTVAVTAGLMVGSAISKDVASFLEENELFVPSDDDDD